MSNVISLKELQMKKMYEDVGSLCLELKKDNVYQAKKDIRKQMIKGYISLLSDLNK